MVIGEKNKGISLISLIVVTIVLIMISGMVTFVATDIIDDSKETKIAKELSTIYDSVEEYYAVNGDIPTLSDETILSVNDFKNQVNNLKGSRYLEALTAEISNSNDENATFLRLDITKIGMDEMTYGTGSNENDFYLISSDNHVIYYYPGFKIGNKIFFSNLTIVKK